MKKIFVIVLFTLCGQYLFAQAQPEMKPNLKKLNRYLYKDEPKDFIAGHWPLKPLTILNRSIDTARFSHTIPQGNVYKLSLDKMPCLRPDTTTYNDEMAEMLLLDNKIPNAIRGLFGKRLIWEKKP